MPRKPSISKDEVFYTVKAAAERAAVSESTIWRAIRDGQLPSLMVRGSRRILKSDMDAWLLSGV